MDQLLRESDAVYCNDESKTFHDKDFISLYINIFALKKRQGLVH